MEAGRAGVRESFRERGEEEGARQRGREGGQGRAGGEGGRQGRAGRDERGRPVGWVVTTSEASGESAIIMLSATCSPRPPHAHSSLPLPSSHVRRAFVSPTPLREAQASARHFPLHHHIHHQFPFHPPLQPFASPSFFSMFTSFSQ